MAVFFLHKRWRISSEGDGSVGGDRDSFTEGTLVILIMIVTVTGNNVGDRDNGREELVLVVKMAVIAVLVVVIMGV